MTFFKRVLSTIVGLIIFSILAIFIFMGIAVAGNKTSQPVNIKNNAVLNLKLDFEIEDYIGKIEYEDYPFLNEYPKHSLFGIIDAINAAKQDPKIKGITIENNDIDAGVAQIRVLRQALQDFKQSGKFVVSYADMYSQKSYYLSSVADTIYTSPIGVVEFKGLSSEQYYFKDFQEKTGVKIEVVRHGKYKSAVEPFLTNQMSPENKEQITSYLTSIWNTLKEDIGKSRDISSEQLHKIADSLYGRNATLALNHKLIDKIAFKDEYTSDLKQQLNIDAKEDLQKINIKDYIESITPPIIIEDETQPKVAIIYAEGEIIYGEGDEDYVGQGIINKSLKTAREDDSIKAIVLRINSPGGSAVASELIWREIEITKQIKPVVVSMGNTAASGGYYIASNANYIVAEPTSITGSIGVFGMLPNINELLNKYGITTHQVTTNNNAISYSWATPLTQTQKKYIKESIIEVYDLFLERVAQGRNITKEQANEIAQGRVWTGTQALEVGLVDQLGDLNLALNKACELAQITNATTQEFPVFKKEFDYSLSQLGFIKSKEELIKEELGPQAYKIWKSIKVKSKQQGIQILLPFNVDIN